VSITVQQVGSLSSIGAGFFSWGGYLYVIGGYDASGTLRSEVWRATVASDGSVGDWEQEDSLPKGIAYAACVATGNMAYVIGGMDSSGLRETIYYTLINSDGSLGFSSSTWETNTIELPEARAAAAPLVLHGRVFLFGGHGSSGTTSSIISARLWSDGQVGQWYETPIPLPAAGEGYAAALFEDELWIAGGSSDVVYRTSIDDDGMPSSWSSETIPGGPTAYPALGSSGDGLILFGGVNEETGLYGRTRVWDGSAWASSTPVQAWGSRGIVMANTLFAPLSVGGTDAPGLASISIATAKADVPLISPGTGTIATNAALKYSTYPGDTIRYTTAAYGETPAEPTSSSAVWTSSSVVSATASYAFRAFRDGEAPSDVLYESYRVRSSSFFVLTQGTVPYGATSEAYTAYTLAETYSDGSQTEVSSVWYKVAVSSQAALSLAWIDADDDAQTYSASIQLSLYESDLYTLVRLCDGSEFYEVEGDASNAVDMTLGTGTYYLQIASSDDSTGGTFALCLSKED